MSQNDIITEYQKILTLLNEAGDSKLVSRKWNIVINNSKANYGVWNEINYNDDHICVRDDIIVRAAGGTQIALKNCAPFTKCIKNCMEKQEMMLKI